MTDFSPPHLLAGRYRLVAPIKQGGFGYVASYEDTVLSRRVAVKFVFSGGVLSLDEETRRLAALSENRHVVTVHDLVATENGFAMVMEHLLGATLDQRLADGIEREEATRWLEEIASALAFMHAKNLTHCDLHAGNVMVVDATKRYVKLLDLGVSRLYGDQQPAAVFPYARTPEYPAQPPAADWYQLGLLAVDLLTGSSLREVARQRGFRLPPSGADIADLRLGVLVYREIALDLVTDRVDHLRPLFDVLLSREAGRRSDAAARAAIEAVAAGRGERHRAGPPETQTAPPGAKGTSIAVGEDAPEATDLSRSTVPGPSNRVEVGTGEASTQGDADATGDPRPSMADVARIRDLYTDFLCALPMPDDGHDSEAYDDFGDYIRPGDRVRTPVERTEMSLSEDTLRTSILDDIIEQWLPDADSARARRLRSPWPSDRLHGLTRELARRHARIIMATARDANDDPGSPRWERRVARHRRTLDRALRALNAQIERWPILDSLSDRWLDVYERFWQHYMDRRQDPPIEPGQVDIDAVWIEARQLINARVELADDERAPPFDKGEDDRLVARLVPVAREWVQWSHHTITLQPRLDAEHLEVAEHRHRQLVRVTIELDQTVQQYSRSLLGASPSREEVIRDVVSEWLEQLIAELSRYQANADMAAVRQAIIARASVLNSGDAEPQVDDEQALNRATGPVLPTREPVEPVRPRRFQDIDLDLAVDTVRPFGERGLLRKQTTEDFWSARELAVAERHIAGLADPTATPTGNPVALALLAASVRAIDVLHGTEEMVTAGDPAGTGLAAERVEGLRQWLIEWARWWVTMLAHSPARPVSPESFLRVWTLVAPSGPETKVPPIGTDHGPALHSIRPRLFSGNREQDPVLRVLFDQTAVRLREADAHGEDHLCAQTRPWLRMLARFSPDDPLPIDPVECHRRFDLLSEFLLAAEAEDAEQGPLQAGLAALRSLLG